VKNLNDFSRKEGKKKSEHIPETECSLWRIEMKWRSQGGSPQVWTFREEMSHKIRECIPPAIVVRRE